MARLLALVLGALVLSGCASTTIFMQHPDGRRAECNLHIGVWQAEQIQRECAAEYKSQGYVRVPQ